MAPVRLQSRAVDPLVAEAAPATDPAGPCTNCGGGPVAQFCASCGQRHLTPGDFTARAFLGQALDEFISVDGRFWHTLWTLLRHPGKLARDYFDGRGARYMRPLNLFLLLNLVFFLVQPHTGLLQWHLAGYLENGPRAVEQVNAVRMERARSREREREAAGAAPRAPVMEPMPVFEAEFESTIQNLKKSMLLVAIPLFALMIGLTYGFRRHRLAEHLVFSTHFYAYTVFVLTVVVQVFFYLAFLLLGAVHASTAVRHAFGGEAALTLMLSLLLGGYLYFGMQRMYGDSRPVAALRATALFGGYQVLVILFAVRMFQVTLWAM